MIDPSELYRLHRIEEMDKGVFKYVFRSYEQIKVGKLMQRQCYDFYRKSEDEAWQALKERLEKRLEESIDE